MLKFIGEQPTLVFYGFFLVLASAGLWLALRGHRSANLEFKKIDEDGSATLTQAPADLTKQQRLALKEKRNQPTSSSARSPDNIASSINEAADWRKVYQLRDTLKIYEAACLLAGETPRLPAPRGAAAGYAEILKEAVLRYEIKDEATNLGKPPYHRFSQGMFSQAEILNEAIKWRNSQIGSGTTIDRKEIIKFFQKKGMRDAVEALGGKFKDVNPSPQSPQGTAQGTPR